MHLLLEYLEGLLAEYSQLNSGKVADYIPELAKANPDAFGISVVTVDGHVYQVGATRDKFTIQSISKVITYGIGITDYGTDKVLNKIDVEPSGEAFNSISLEPNTGRPRNPMINAGAIAAMAFVGGDSMPDKLQRILNTYRDYLGHEVKVDESVYLSEKVTGHRNRAIASMLRNYNILEADEEGLLDLYFKQCSILVDCRDLALMAATLANGGVNPITGVRAVRNDIVPKLLSVMNSCGMYDFSGAWIYEVGMPAKSGVAGGVMAVLPGQLGIAVYSPPLDDRGNSVRGIAVCKRLSRDYGLHMFHTGRTTATFVVHSSYSGKHVASKRSRSAQQTRYLIEQGDHIMVLELQGDLLFASAEIVVNEAAKAAENAQYVIVDFRRIASINSGALNMLSFLVQQFDQSDKKLIFTNVRDEYAMTAMFKKRVPHIRETLLLNFEDIDDALEWCEDQLLGEKHRSDTEEVSLAEQPFCFGLSSEELTWLEAFLDSRHYQKGEVVCRIGEPATELYFIISGQISVMVPLDSWRKERMKTLSAGTAFGEMAALDRGVRSANIVADTSLHCRVLDFERLEQYSSGIGVGVRIKIITNIGRELTAKLRQATLEISSLKR